MLISPTFNLMSANTILSSSAHRLKDYGLIGLCDLGAMLRSQLQRRKKHLQKKPRQGWKATEKEIWLHSRLRD